MYGSIPYHMNYFEVLYLAVELFLKAFFRKLLEYQMHENA